MAETPAPPSTGAQPGVEEEPVVPDYGGACLSQVAAALLSPAGDSGPHWVPAVARHAAQVVLLVLDGLGWHQLETFKAVAPTLSGGSGGPITSVAPTTTATALTSITTGTTPAEHGIVGYRLRLGWDQSAAARPDDEVMNVLRWRSGSGDLRRRVPAPQFQTIAPFGGRHVPAVTRGDFAATGFTAAHLSGARLVGWSVPSTLVVEVRRLLAQGEPFVYAYYEGLDRVSHAHGLGAHFGEELRFVDHLVADLIDALPPGAVLVVTSDHGQVEVGAAAHLPGRDLLDATVLISGEGRFRWLHVRPGALDDVVDMAKEAHGHEAWVRTRDEVIDDGWFGGKLADGVATRLGDVALVARAPIAFLDPADTGEARLAGRHGSLTAAEMYVPLLAWGNG